MTPELTPAGNYNWAMAFLHYCRDISLQEISDVVGIPLKTLKSRVAAERWAALKSEAHTMLPSVIDKTSPCAVEVRAKMELIKRHRDELAAVAAELREDIREAVARLRRGDKLKQYFFSSKTATVVEHDVDWSIKDRLLLAQYIASVAQLGYQALGDATWTGKGDGTSGPANTSSVPRITVILPGAIQSPRDAIDAHAPGTVIDINPTPI